ncbi:MAG: DNA repair exonuclease [Candidatus Diapherotrites archaeon]
MKIGIFSDTHLGFDEKGERNKECFDNLNQAIDLCIQEKADFVVLPGDVFHNPVPSHDVLFNSFKSFSKSKNVSSNLKLFLEKNGEKKQIEFSGLPILTIHGNHEYRGKETKTALDVLDLSGLIQYFHAGTITVENNSEKVCVHGLGAVPEKKALEVLNYWNPKPVQNNCNLLLLHQGFKEFMAVDDEMIATLSLDNLPKGFNLIINGHLHWYNEQKLGETTFLLPGSTISTSIKKLESEKPKGVHFFDSKTKEFSFKPFPLQRRMFYHKVSFENADVETVLNECKKIISNDLSEKHEIKPLIRLNLKGTLKKGLSSGDINLAEILNEFSEKAILSVSKNFSSLAFKKKISELREMQKSRLSLAAVGFELFEKNLNETDFENAFDVKKLFDVLSESNLDEAMNLVAKKKE